MNKFFVFSKMLDFVATHYDVTDADMNNYSGDIEITGTEEDGSTINIKVRITEAKKEEETDGN